MRRVVMLVALVLLLPLHVHAATAPSLATLNLQRSDMPAGLVRIEDHTDTPGEIAAEVRNAFRDLSEQGLVGLHDVAYDFGSRRSSTGIQELGSVIELYRTAALAHTAYSEVARIYQDAPAEGGHPLVAPSIGAERFAYEDVQPHSTPLTIYLTFRRGPYLVRMAIVQPIKSVPYSLLVHLGQVIDGRIQHVH